MSELHSWANTFVAIGALAITLILASRGNLRSQVKLLATLEVKVDAMWTFHLRRGVVEGVNSGLFTVNSPVRLEPKSREIIEHLAIELRDFRLKECPDCGERELAMKIEERFGNRLVKEVCIPNNISLSACLLIATSIAMGGKPLTEILDDYVPPLIA